jgi:hypothetical protein
VSHLSLSVNLPTSSPSLAHPDSPGKTGWDNARHPPVTFRLPAGSPPLPSEEDSLLPFSLSDDPSLHVHHDLNTHHTEHEHEHHTHFVLLHLYASLPRARVRLHRNRRGRPVVGHMAARSPSRVEPESQRIPQPAVQAAQPANTQARDTDGAFAPAPSKAECERVDWAVAPRANSRDGAQADHRGAYLCDGYRFGVPAPDREEIREETGA